MNTSSLYEKLQRESVFIFYGFEDVVFRSEPPPSKKYFKKFKGGQEMEMKGDDRLFNDAIISGGQLVNKKFYDNY